MKEDAPAPKHPPRKRYQLEKALPLWLAQWASDPDLPQAERDRVQAERDRRKALDPDMRVGILVDLEGVNQIQTAQVTDWLSGLKATEIHHPFTSRPLHNACMATGVPVTVHGIRDQYKGMREVVLASDLIFAAPRGPRKFDNQTPAWDAIQYAKHRKTPVRVVLPDGTVEGEG